MRVMSIAQRLPGPYRDLIATSGVPSLIASGFTAQLTQAAGPLGLLLVTQQLTGSLADRRCGRRGVRRWGGLRAAGAGVADRSSGTDPGTRRRRGFARCGAGGSGPPGGPP